MNIEDVKINNEKSKKSEGYTTTTVYLPTTVSNWYKEKQVSKRKVLLKFAEENGCVTK